MADLFSITAPLMIRLPDGEEKVIAEHFPHPDGLLYFDLYWHLGKPGNTLHVVKGSVSGDGPWKVGDHVLNVLGCVGTNASLAFQFEQWREWRMTAGNEYPPEGLVLAIARKMGATLPTPGMQ